MLTRFLAIPQMQTPFDTLFEQAQPDTTKIFSAPFLISDRISERALIFQHPFLGRSPFQGGRLFCFLNILSRVWKANCIFAVVKWRIISIRQVVPCFIRSHGTINQHEWVRADLTVKIYIVGNLNLTCTCLTCSFSAKPGRQVMPTQIFPLSSVGRATDC